MKIDGFNSPIDSGQGPASKADAPQDQFLRLLVAQLQYQDPLEPQDGSEFVAQLAQFTTLEQMAESNDRLAAIELQQSAAARTALTGLVGRTVTADGSSFSTDAEGEPPAISLHLGAPANNVKVEILDASGRSVRTVDLGRQNTGEVAVPWGKGPRLPPGAYTVSVEATNEGGGNVTTKTRLIGKVDSLTFDNNNTLLKIGAVSIAPAGIISIHD